MMILTKHLFCQLFNDSLPLSINLLIEVSPFVNHLMITIIIPSTLWWQHSIFHQLFDDDTPFSINSLLMTILSHQLFDDDKSFPINSLITTIISHQLFDDDNHFINPLMKTFLFHQLFDDVVNPLKLTIVFSSTLWWRPSLFSQPFDEDNCCFINLWRQIPTKGLTKNPTILGVPNYIQSIA